MSELNQALEEGANGESRPVGERFRYDCLLKLVPLEMKDRLEHEFYWGSGERSYERAMKYVKSKTNDFHGQQVGARYLGTASKKASADDPMIIGAFVDESAAATCEAGAEAVQVEGGEANIMQQICALAAGYQRKMNGAGKGGGPGAQDQR